MSMFRRVNLNETKISESSEHIHEPWSRFIPGFWTVVAQMHWRHLWLSVFLPKGRPISLNPTCSHKFLMTLCPHCWLYRRFPIPQLYHSALAFTELDNGISHLTVNLPNYWSPETNQRFKGIDDLQHGWHLYLRCRLRRSGRYFESEVECRFRSKVVGIVNACGGNYSATPNGMRQFHRLTIEWYIPVSLLYLSLI